MAKENILRASDIAYQKIKNSILEHKLKPGEKLGKRDMAAYCGVSTIPVIEALGRLESEGFIESSPYTGSRVVIMNKNRKTDLLILRESIEVQIVRILCFSLGLDTGQLFLQEAKEIDKLSGLQKNDEDYNTKHYNFHMGLAKATKSDSLIKELKKIQLFSLLEEGELKYSSIPHPNKDLYTHEDIISSILRRNTIDAETIMRKHIYRSQVVEKPYWV